MALHQGGSKSLLAAMALLAAARHETDPFANPVYIGLAEQAKDDPRIPVLAMATWIELIGIRLGAGLSGDTCRSSGHLGARRRPQAIGRGAACEHRRRFGVFG